MQPSTRRDRDAVGPGTSAGVIWPASFSWGFYFATGAEEVRAAG